MDMLASMAEVSKRTVYNHFDSKDALFMQLMTELWQQAKQQVGISYDPKAPLHPQLYAIVEAEIEVICSAEHLEMNRVAFGHFFYHPQALKQEIEKLAADESAVLRWIKAALDDERLKPLDPQIGAEQIHSLIKGRCFWPQLMQIAPLLDAEQRHELADQTVAMFLSHYGV